MISVDVYIWRQKGSSVGHAMMTETCSKNVLLSQFPHKPNKGTSISGKNIQYSFVETFRAEARPANHIFVIKLPNGNELRKEVRNQVLTPNWSPFPQKTESPAIIPGVPIGTHVNRHVTTHCSWAVKEALRAGGLTIATDTMLGQSVSYLPGILADALLRKAGKRVFGQFWSINVRSTPWCPVPL
jgi:hypothetical protein